MAVRARSTLKYMLLPEILPRIRDFSTSGFYYVALFIALAFARARLLPVTHPYLDPANAGRFSIRQVLAEGRRHLVFRRENADQIIIYYTILGGLFLLFVQAVFLVLTLAIHHAQALDPTTASWNFFVTPNPANDIAFRLLDYVFGYPNIFGSCLNSNVTCPAGPFQNSTQTWPTPFHSGMHALFTFYNFGVAIVGFVIFLYMVVTLVGNTARTGKPFGKEFNYWTPVRLIIAIGLLAPFANGLNGAQLFTLYVAKWGSSLATNGWITFNQKLTGGTTMLGMPANLVFKPSQPNADGLLQFMLVAKTCAHAQRLMNEEAVSAYQVATDSTGAQAAWPLPGDFNQALANSGNEDIILRFGIQDSYRFRKERGYVSPVCGEINIPVQDVSSPGAMAVQSDYYNMLVARWNDPDNDTLAKQIALKTLPMIGHSPGGLQVSGTDVKNARGWMSAKVDSAINNGRAAQQGDSRWNQDVTTLGWGGASIWFNKIAEYNGSYISSALHVPVASHYPTLMEQTARQRQEHDNDTGGEARFRPSFDDDTLPYFPGKGDINIAVATHAAESVWAEEKAPSRGSPIDDMLSGIFGFKGVYDLLGNKNVHPLAQLVGIGRSLIDNAVSSITVSAGVGALGQLAKLFSNGTIQTVGGMAVGAGNILFSIAAMCFLIGFFLFYGVPFIPFVYFFFAMGNWVKAVFEAMVGLPLWALSFIRANEEGLVSHASINGFYLLLEILLRPILIVFGFIAAIAVFSAEALVLSQIWTVVITNLGGGDPSAAATTGVGDYTRSILDGFFYTIVYTIIIYMLALSSFKLIDLFPKSMLRWMGSHADPLHVGGDSGVEFMKSMGRVSQEVQAGFGGGITSILFRNQ